MTDEEIPNVGDPPPTYIIFLLVFFFFITGLLGFLICHLLKTKGYRCELEEDQVNCEDKPGTDKDDESEDSQDTVEQILKCIIENEANMEAFKDMFTGQNVCEHQDPRLPQKDGASGLPLHHHTVHLGGEISSCVHCMQERLLKTRRKSRVARSKARLAEQTVFSVGRFRVTHMEKRNSLQGSINLSASKPGNTSNDTTLSDSKTGFKDTSKKPQEEYNIRNMFKDSGATNGKVLNVGKRKKSVTLLSFFKGADPVDTKGVADVIEDDKEGSSTPDQLSVSLGEGLSSVALSPTDETALDENANKGSGKLEKTSLENEKADEATLNVKSHDKLSTNTTEIVGDSSNDCSRFVVVRTTEETVIPPAAAVDHRGDETTKLKDIKTGQVSQESTDNQQI
ncbi:RELT-like protein 2 isoform X2 [Pimephales promelas]|nr:RELT-like protein 2 isoform X2 [Pimephales promelas]XP_039550195.1 RELT-like protein 2 isoform X2 [Pimephales promelas]XP_039550196.1 RELT-like protein 2 isoform X2 [Pimephales promelas]XP_039550197.1 RELT-like protein 2 isoform X2 [Pimephales promelas]